MKVIMLNGSPKANGNTALALAEMEKVFAQEGVETELIHVGQLPIRSCIACNKCGATGKCVFDDIVNEVAEKTASWSAALSTMPPLMRRLWRCSPVCSIPQISIRP